MRKSAQKKRPQACQGPACAREASSAHRVQMAWRPPRVLPSGFRHSDARRGGVGAGAGGKTAVGTPNYRRLRSTLQLVGVTGDERAPS